MIRLMLNNYTDEDMRALLDILIAGARQSHVQPTIKARCDIERAICYLEYQLKLNKLDSKEKNCPPPSIQSTKPGYPFSK